MQAPVDLVPIANQGEDQQDKSDYQKTAGLRRVHHMPMMPVGGILFRLGGEHGSIVRPSLSRSQIESDVVMQAIWL